MLFGHNQVSAATMFARHKLIVAWLALTFAYLVAGVVVFALSLPTNVVLAVLLPPYIASAILIFVVRARIRKLSS